jgi:hypothetical protein
MILIMHGANIKTAVRWLATMDDMQNEYFKRFNYKRSVETECLIQVHRK